MKIRLCQPQLIFEVGQRSNQEDYIYAPDPKEGGRIFILCDGMGGHEKGEVASSIIAEEVARYLNTHLPEDCLLTDGLFEQAFEYACQCLDQKDDGNGGMKKMGTTFTFLCFHKGGCLAAHVGDSRIYHIRPSERRMLYKSKDHSLVVELYQAGEISFSEMSTSKQKNVITRAVMPGKEQRVRADIVHITDIRPGDYFYQCSDGMMEHMGDDELVDVIAREVSDEEKQQLLTVASANNRDNHSAILLKVSHVESERGDESYVGDEETSPYNALLMRWDDEDDEGTVTLIPSNEEGQVDHQKVEEEDDEHTAFVIPEKSSGKPAQQQGNTNVTQKKGSWGLAIVSAIIMAALVATLLYYL